MKKALALLLTVVLLSTPLLAFADDGFFMIFTALQSVDFLGDPDVASYLTEEYDTETVQVIIRLDEGSVLVIGRADEDQPAGACWEGRQSGQLFLLAYTMCVSYEDLSSYCEKGLEIIIFTSGDSDYALINNAEDAARFVSIIDENLAAESVEETVEEPAATEAE